MFKKINDWLNSPAPQDDGPDIGPVGMIVMIVIFGIVVKILSELGIMEPWYLIPPK